MLSLRELERDNPYTQRALERESALFMDGRDDQGDWVLRNRKSGTVLEFDEARGFILEDHRGTEIFVNGRAVKRLNEPPWRHNLKRGERVRFAKTQGVKGYWAAVVKRIEEITLEDDTWEEDADSLMTSNAPNAPSNSPGDRSLVTGSVYVQGNAMVQLTSNAHHNPYMYQGHPPLRPRGALSRGSPITRLETSLVPSKRE